MTTEADSAAISSRFVAWIRTAASRNTLLNLLAGVLAGASLAIVGGGSITIPVVGSISSAGPSPVTLRPPAP